jgi:hypothetical protein
LRIGCNPEPEKATRRTKKVSNPTITHPSAEIFMLPRVAQPGDLFILLVPNGEELVSLQQWQMDLQSQYGGRRVEPMHITVERFSPEHTTFAGDCLTILRPILEMVKPFPIFSDQLIQFYAPYWQQHVLRWRVQETPGWLAFKEITTLALAEVGCPSHFVRERHATCTALFLESEADLDSNPPGIHFPASLFTAREVLISLLEAPEQFTILDTIEINAEE